MRRLLLVPFLLVAAAGIAAIGASADGGPSPGATSGGNGVRAAGAPVRYVAVQSGPSTTLAVVAVRGGRVLRWTSVRGWYGVPLVAYDGSAGGLSGDGKTLVLASFASQPSPSAVTRFAVVTTKTLKLRRIVTLRGSWSYDALSPDGSTLYLVEYLTAAPASEYRVRAFDLEAGRLVPGAIVDKSEREDSMRGFPVTRASSFDGGWAYTLYRRDHAPAFVHALDTRGRAAVCVDLPWTDRKAVMWNVRIGVASGGRQLVLRQPGVGRLAVIDTKTWRVTALRAPAAP